MPDTVPFATDILLTAAAGLAVLGAHRISAWTRIPFSALVLVVTAAAAAAVPGTHRPSETLVTRIVTVALIAVLFAGGMSMGGHRFRAAAASILVLGLPGTFATATLGALFAHYALRFGWYPSILLATAVAPTDPTVVFSVLGRQRVAGRSGTILEGESGANDPVGIALMTGLLGAGGLTAAGVGHAAGTFAVQISVGAAIGLAGGRGLLWLIRRLDLPGPGLDPLLTTVAAYLIYGLAAEARGSGFLAVFLAGILIGDHEVPHRAEIENFHDALGSLGEMAAFVILGLTVNLHTISRLDVWGPGLALGAALAVLIRPAVVQVGLLGTDLERRERRFVQFAGLKGAVPILLGSYLLGTHLDGNERLYGVVIVVVVFSVVAQGGLVGPAISYLGLPVKDPDAGTIVAHGPEAGVDRDGHGQRRAGGGA